MKWRSVRTSSTPSVTSSPTKRNPFPTTPWTSEMGLAAAPEKMKREVHRMRKAAGTLQLHSSRTFCSTLTFLVPRPGYLITNQLHPHDFRRRRSSGSSSTGRGSRRGSGEEEDPPPDDLEEDWPSAPPIDILDSIKVKHLSSNVLETCHS